MITKKGTKLQYKSDYFISIRFYSTRHLFANSACVIVKSACHLLVSLQTSNAPRTPVSITVVLFYAEADLSCSGYLLLIFAGIKREWSQRRTLARGHFNSDVITLMRRGTTVLVC